MGNPRIRDMLTVLDELDAAQHDAATARRELAEARARIDCLTDDFTGARADGTAANILAAKDRAMARLWAARVDELRATLAAVEAIGWRAIVERDAALAREEATNRALVVLHYELNDGYSEDEASGNIAARKACALLAEVIAEQRERLEHCAERVRGLEGSLERVRVQRNETERARQAAETKVLELRRQLDEERTLAAKKIAELQQRPPRMTFDEGRIARLERLVQLLAPFRERAVSQREAFFDGRSTDIPMSSSLEAFAEACSDDMVLHRIFDELAARAAR